MRVVGDRERVDLPRKGVRLVGDDPLDHREPLLDLGRARDILGGFLGGVERFDLELLFLQLEEALGEIEDQQRRQPDADQQADGFPRTQYARPP